MYCRKCGSEMREGQTVCMECGFAVGTGEGYCAHCGTACDPGQAVCTACGFALGPAPAPEAEEQAGGKSKVIAGVLGLVLGAWGVHNFYLGYTGRGVAKVLLNLGALLTAFLTPILSALYNMGQVLRGEFSHGPVALFLLTLISTMVLSGVRIWALIESIFYFIGHKGYTTDAKGRRLSN